MKGKVGHLPGGGLSAAIADAAEANAAGTLRVLILVEETDDGMSYQMATAKTWPILATMGALSAVQIEMAKDLEGWR